MDTPDEGRFAKSRKIGRVSHDGEIGVAAKLGRALEYARLPAHEQRADAVLLHRRIAAERGVALDSLGNHEMFAAIVRWFDKYLAAPAPAPTPAPAPASAK